MRYCCLIALALVGVAFCFPMQAEGASEEVVLRVQGLPAPGSTDPAGVAGSRILAEFKRRYPHVIIQPAEGLRIESVVAEATTVMMIEGGIAPDVMWMNFRSMDSFTRQGLVLPLDPFLDREKSAGNDILSGIPAQIRPVISRSGPEGDRHIYGLPSQLLVMGLFFNRELFRQAGLPDRAPRDWAELQEFSRRITALGNGVKGLFMNSGTSASWSLMSFLWSAGGEAVQEVGPDDWRAVFNTPEAVEAFLFYYQLVEIDRSVLRLSRSLSAQEQKDVGMVFNYVGDTIKLDSEIWGFGPVPKGPTGLRGSEINAGILGIFSGVKDPAKQEAAWNYIRFITGPEAERIQVDTLVELGQADRINPVTLRRLGLERYLALIPKGVEEDFHEALLNGRPEPFGRNCNLVYTEMTYPLDQILLSSSIRAAWLAGDREAARAEAGRILDRAVGLTNERMLGHVAPGDMKMRRMVALLVVAVIVVAFAFVGRIVFLAFSRNAALMNRPVNSRSVVPWLCLFPALALIFIWHYVPLARGTLMAFLDYRIVLESTFVGLDNFALVLFDRTFWNGLLATLHFAAWTLTVGFIVPIALAYSLHLIPRGRIFFRTVYYLPAVISGTAVFFLWRELFGAEGVLNEILRFAGFEARRAWTEDPNLAMLSCVIPGIWAGAGPGCLIYLAALKTIPEEQFEACELDGAGFFLMTRTIVFPALKPLIAINFIGVVAAAFHGATNILIMTGGGPNGRTEVVALLIFFEAFTRLRFGPATAMAWIIGSLLVGFTVFQLKRLSQMEFRTARK